MGLLDTIGAALKYGVPEAATARGAYLQGQDQEEDKQLALRRQSLVDQMEAKYKQSQIGENNARSDYYKSMGDTEGVTYQRGIDPTTGLQTLIAMPKRIARDSSGGASGQSPTGSTGGSTGPGSQEGRGSASNDANPQGPGPAGPSSANHREPLMPIDDNAGGRGGDADAGANAAAASLPPTPSLIDKMSAVYGGQTGAPAPASAGAPTTPSSTPLLDKMASGMSQPAAPMIGRPTGVRVAGPVARVSKSNYIDPSDGAVYDIYNDGTRKKIRDATPTELAKSTAIPAPKTIRSGSGYAQWNPATGKFESNGVAAPDLASTSPEYLATHRENEIRKRAFALMKPQPGKYAGIRTPGLDQDAALARASQEYDAAASAAGTAKPGRSAAPSGNGGARSPQDAATATELLIRSGKITLDHALSSPYLSDAAKTELQKRMGTSAGKKSGDITLPEDDE